MKIKVNLPDGRIEEWERGKSALDMFPSRKIYAVKINGEIKDVYTPLEKDCQLEILTENTPETLDLLRHSAAHLMAHAVLRIFKDVEFAIGPTIEDGFYYDFDLKHTLSPEDFPKIEEEMKKIVKEDLPIRRIEMSKEEARNLLLQMKAKFKLEMLEEIKEDMVSFYKQGDFIDWCRGPHLPSTGYIKHFKLLKVAGAYWRGDEKREMLQRIYGTAFFTKEELQEYLKFLEEAQKRDHKRIGKQCKLWSFHQEGPGFPFFLPHGMRLYDNIVNYVKEKHYEKKYVQVKGPIILNEELWRRSGHWDHFKENMYFTEIDEVGYAVKPMNCPGHILMYKEDLHSYKDLPLKFFELGLVHRHEKSGVLNGLLRVRAFTQDDAHIFCTVEQIKDAIKEVVLMVFEIYKDFGFKEWAVALSTMPDKAMGSKELWERAENALKEALGELSIDYKLKPKEGAFYGPKIDFTIKDSLKRDWQCGTIQLDFSLPERFELEYMEKDGRMARPVMIHRAILGSLERFMAIITENYGGNFPLWLSPRQVAVLPVSEKKFGEYAREVGEILKKEGFFVDVDLRDESLGKKIREATQLKTNYLFIVGEREEREKSVSVRTRDGKDLGSFSLKDIIEKLKNEIKEKKGEL
ncbi:MAG: threonine--tRNA ligase [Thermoanaerobaculia bacterium]